MADSSALALTPSAPPERTPDVRTYVRFEVATAKEIADRVADGTLTANAKVYVDRGEADGPDVRTVLEKMAKELDPDPIPTYAGTTKRYFYEDKPTVEEIPAQRNWSFPRHDQGSSE